MRLVVDSNILFAALIKNSATRKILMHSRTEFLTIDFSTQEIMKYKDEILKKTNLSVGEFELLLSKIKEKLITIEEEIILTKFEEAYIIMKEIDVKDAPFIAAALATKADVWSDDPHFQRQRKVKVWKTKDLIELI